MLLAMDIGNSNTVLGVYGPGGEGGMRFAPELAAHWRIVTAPAGTADEYAVLLRSLFQGAGLAMEAVTGIAVSSVVPPQDAMVRQVCERAFGVKPLFIEPGVRTGLPVLVDNPAEVGADRIVNCVAGYERFHGPCIVVDMGTATTFDVISAKGEFLGGAIAPGLGISAEALFARAARLPRIEVKKPAKVIGTGTVDNIQIGLYYGYIGLVDGILERMLEEFRGRCPEGVEVRTIATGGLAGLIAGGSRYVQEVDEHLTLTGLRLLYERNLDRAQERQARVRSHGPREQG